MESLSVLKPSNAAVATLVQSTKMQRFLKIILTLSCWYSLDSSYWVLLNEYPYARVWVIFSPFLHHFILANLATSSVRVNPFLYKMAEKLVPIKKWLRIQSFLLWWLIGIVGLIKRVKPILNGSTIKCTLYEPHFCSWFIIWYCISIKTTWMRNV